MSFLDKVEAIRSELGLPAKNEMSVPDLVKAAMQFMGIVPEASWAAPQQVDAVVKALGMTFGESSSRTMRRWRRVRDMRRCVEGESGGG